MIWWQEKSHATSYPLVTSWPWPCDHFVPALGVRGVHSAAQGGLWANVPVKVQAVGEGWVPGSSCCVFFLPPEKKNIYIYMDVSENNGTPKSSILIGVSIINHPFWGTPIFGNTHMYPLSWLQATCSPCKINGFSWFLDGSVRVSLAHAPSFSDQVV